MKDAEDDATPQHQSETGVGEGQHPWIAFGFLEVSLPHDATLLPDEQRGQQRKDRDDEQQPEQAVIERQGEKIETGVDAEQWLRHPGMDAVGVQQGATPGRQSPDDAG